jgi:hypothetical protein
VSATAGTAEYPIQFAINVNQGQPVPTMAAAFQYTGGVGGTLSFQIQSVPAPNGPNNLFPGATCSTSQVGCVTVDGRHKTITFTPNLTGNISLPVGSYPQTVTLSESDPQFSGGSAVLTFQLTVNVAAPITTISSSIPNVDLTDSAAPTLGRCAALAARARWTRRRPQPRTAAAPCHSSAQNP